MSGSKEALGEPYVCYECGSYAGPRCKTCKTHFCNIQCMAVAHAHHLTDEQIARASESKRLAPPAKSAISTTSATPDGASKQAPKSFTYRPYLLAPAASAPAHAPAPATTATAAAAAAAAAAASSSSADFSASMSTKRAEPPFVFEFPFVDASPVAPKVPSTRKTSTITFGGPTGVVVVLPERHIAPTPKSRNGAWMLRPQNGRDCFLPLATTRDLGSISLALTPAICAVIEARRLELNTLGSSDACVNSTLAREFGLHRAPLIEL